MFGPAALPDVVNDLVRVQSPPLTKGFRLNWVLIFTVSFSYRARVGSKGTRGLEMGFTGLYWVLARCKKRLDRI